MSVTNPNFGLQLDAATLALYKGVQEVAWSQQGAVFEAATSWADDSGNGWNLTGSGSVGMRSINSPLGTAGWLGLAPALTQFDAFMYAGLSELTSAVVNATVPTACRSDHTIQIMFRWEWDLSAQRGIDSVVGGNTGETVGTDFVERILGNTNGSIQIFSENIGVDKAFTSSAGLIVPGSWEVLTIKFVSTGAETFDVFVFMHTLTGLVVSGGLASSGTIGKCNTNSGAGTGRICFGALGPGYDSSYVGAYGYTRLVKEVLSDPTINAQATELLTTGTIAAPGANDLYRYEFNNLPNHVDEGPYGSHFNTTTSNHPLPFGVPNGQIDICGTGGRAQQSLSLLGFWPAFHFARTLQTLLGAASPVRGNDFFTDALQPVPEWTFQMWGYRFAGGAGGMLVSCDSVSGETLATNDVLNVSSAAGFFAERGAGVDITKTLTVGTIDTSDAALFHRVLITIRSIESVSIPGRQRYTFSFNDDINVLYFETSGVPQGGDSQPFTAFSMTAGGLWQEFKFSLGSIPDAQIIADAARINTSGPVDVIVPVIDNFNVAPGSSIPSDQIIEFDVTDETALCVAVLIVTYVDGSAYLAHDGINFRGDFQGSPNNRVVITGGYRFSLRPRNGWVLVPARLEFLVLDRAGNTGVAV